MATQNSIDSPLVLPVERGGTGAPTVEQSFDSLAPSTSKGDLIVYGSLGNIRLGAGEDGKILQADSTSEHGLVWADAPAGGGGGGVIEQVLGTAGEIDVTASTVAPVASLVPTGVVSGTYSNITLTVDQKGRITSASSGSGDATLAYTGVAGQITVTDNLIGLATTGVASGTYENVSLTVDSTGRISSISGDPQGILPIAKGGTALATATPNALLAVNSAGTAYTQIAPPTVDNSVLLGYTGSTPIWSNGPLGVGNGGVGATTLDPQSLLISNSGGTGIQSLSYNAPDIGFLLASGTADVNGAAQTTPGWTNGTTKLVGSSFNGVIVSGSSSTSGFQNVSPGTAGFVLTSNGTSAAPSFKAAYTPAVKSDQVTATNNLLPVVPAVQQFHPSAAKTWVRFTVSGGVVTASTGYNVNTVTRTGAGVFQILFITAFTTASYAVQVTAMSTDPTNAAIQPICSVRTLATGSVTINSVTSSSPAYTDFAEYYVVCFGTQ